MGRCRVAKSGVRARPVVGAARGSVVGTVGVAAFVALGVGVVVCVVGGVVVVVVDVVVVVVVVVGTIYCPKSKSTYFGTINSFRGATPPPLTLSTTRRCFDPESKLKPGSYPLPLHYPTFLSPLDLPPLVWRHPRQVL